MNGGRVCVLLMCAAAAIPVARGEGTGAGADSSRTATNRIVFKTRSPRVYNARVEVICPEESRAPVLADKKPEATGDAAVLPDQGDAEALSKPGASAAEASAYWNQIRAASVRRAVEQKNKKEEEEWGALLPRSSLMDLGLQKNQDPSGGLRDDSRETGGWLVEGVARLSELQKQTNTQETARADSRDSETETPEEAVMASLTGQNRNPKPAANEENRDDRYSQPSEFRQYDRTAGESNAYASAAAARRDGDSSRSQNDNRLDPEKDPPDPSAMEKEIARHARPGEWSASATPTGGTAQVSDSGNSHDAAKIPDGRTLKISDVSWVASGTKPLPPPGRMGAPADKWGSVISWEGGSRRPAAASDPRAWSAVNTGDRNPRWSETGSSPGAAGGPFRSFESVFATPSRDVSPPASKRLSPFPPPSVLDRQPAAGLPPR